MKTIPITAALVVLCTDPVAGPAQVTSLSFLTNGLVAYYPLNGNAEDASGNGNHGLAVGAVLTTDRFGRQAHAYQFNGSNSYIVIPAYPSLNAISNSVTISAWVKLTAAPPRSFNIMDIITSGQECSLGLFTDSTRSVTNEVFFPQQGQIASGHHPLSVGKYYHLVATSSNRVGSAFLDGSRVSSASAYIFLRPPGLGWNIGAWFNEGVINYGFVGVIEDVRLYKRALSTNEVADLYRMESAPPFAPSLAIQVKTVRVNLFLQPGGNYQLETSPDLTQWTPYGVPFTASSATMFEDFDVLNGLQYFRIIEVPQ